MKTSKLYLWNELFNTLQDHKERIREINMDRRNVFSRMMNTNTLFFMQNAGEHWMQTRTSLALADAYRMKSPSGKEVSLWDAMVVIPIVRNGKKVGARLEVKKGYKKQDGSDFTQKDIIEFSNKVKGINQRMHGIYNKADMNAFQRLAVGRMAFLYRKWVVPSFNRRWAGIIENKDLGSWTEGYYRTTFRFLTGLYRDVRNSQLQVGARWKELSNTERANIKRALTEVSHFLALSLALGLIEFPRDKNRPWAIKMSEYQLRRLYSEVGVFVPWKSSVTEGLRMVKSPSAAINTGEDILNTIDVLNPFAYSQELQSGRYKGHSRAYRSFMESPIVPLNRTIYRSLNPEQGIPFFLQ